MSSGHSHVDHDDEIDEDEEDGDNSGSISGNGGDHHGQSTEINHTQYDQMDDDDGQNDMRYEFVLKYFRFIWNIFEYLEIYHQKR